MDSPAANHLDIFDIYGRYCDIMSGAYATRNLVDELQKARFTREALNQLMKLVDSSLHIRQTSLSSRVSMILSSSFSEKMDKRTSL